MRTYRFFLAMAGVLWSTLVMSDPLPSPLTGYFAHDSRDIIIELREFNGRTQGIIRRESEHPEVVGQALLSDLKFFPGQQLWRGTINLVRRGEQRDVSVEMPDADHFRMRVKASMFKRTVSWHRVSKPPQS